MYYLRIVPANLRGTKSDCPVISFSHDSFAFRETFDNYNAKLPPYWVNEVGDSGR